MSFKKFGDKDVFINTMKAYPQNEFLIYDSKIYWNNIPDQVGVRHTKVRNVPAGFVSLYEYNIDRPRVNTARSIGTGSLKDKGQIYPWISKDSAGASFKTVGLTTWTNEFRFGSVLTSSYPLSASIVREYITTPYASTASYNKRFVSLKNRLNFYGLQSEHFKVSSSFGNKNTQTLNLLSIPSIFFGAQIKPGTLSLKWYFTGSLAGELQDLRQNGELVQVGPRGSPGSGSIAGVAMYNEGFILLTGSWNLNNENISLVSGGRRGEVNYSNNPTYLKWGQDRTYFTSSHAYEEPANLEIKNFVSSAFTDYEVDFKRQVYISRIAVYDESKNLIGIATLSNPILKEEDQDYTFKLKLDI
jgi:hypothetical protein